MFKYVRYTPFTDEYTTHEFTEVDDKCKVHRFDVPFVSVECSTEDDFASLMSSQNPSIEAVEITKEEFYDMVQNSDQIKRIYEIANAQFAKEMQIISEKYSQEERDTWPVQTEEAKAVKAGLQTSTPFLDALSKEDGLTLDEAADKVLAKKTEYSEYSSACMARKWETIRKLKAEVGL